MISKIADIGLISRRTLHATVIRACQSCGAPGTYHDVPDVNVGCFDPARKGLPVGPVCPNCGAPRPEDEDRGEIWRKDYYVWDLVWDRLKAIFRRAA